MEILERKTVTPKFYLFINSNAELCSHNLYVFSNFHQLFSFCQAHFLIFLAIMCVDVTIFFLLVQITRGV